MNVLLHESYDVVDAEASYDPLYFSFSEPTRVPFGSGGLVRKYSYSHTILGKVEVEAFTSDAKP